MVVKNRFHRQEFKNRRRYRILGIVSRRRTCFEYGDELLRFLTELVLEEGQKVQYREPREIFESLLWRCRERSFLGMYPVVRREIYQFQSPGLCKEEKKTFVRRIRFSRRSVLRSFYFFSSFLLPQMQKFFDNFSKSSRQELGDLDLRVSYYLEQRRRYSFLLTRILQIPVLVYQIVEKERILVTFHSSRRNFRRQITRRRRILATRRTPPDVGSQRIVARRRIRRLESCRRVLCRQEAKKCLEQQDLKV